MDLYMLIWALLLALGIDDVAAERCPASRGTSFNLSVASRRNLTGHWLVSADGVAELPQQPSLKSSPVEVVVNIGHRTASREGMETVHLSTSAVVNAILAVEEVSMTSTITTTVDHVTSATLPLNVTNNTSQAPPAGYEVVNGLGYYKMHTISSTWQQARYKCEQERVHLIIINSEREAEVGRTLFVRDQAKIQGADSTDQLYVGFDDIDKEGNYTTVLGEPLWRSGYTRWDSAASHNNKVRNCGAISTSASLLIGSCHFKRAFICEIGAQ